MGIKKNIVELKVDGMTCNNCAASLNRFLERKGLEEVYVNFQTKEVRYNQAGSAVSLEEVKKGIHKLGYSVVEDDDQKPWWTLERKLLVSAIFTAPLLLHHLFMMVGITLFPFLENSWLQMILCLPVYTIGFLHFGRSALSSLKGGVPNMDVLIFVGSTAAFAYSLTGSILGNPDYIFYETAATIITLVLVGNWLEKRSVDQTTTAIEDLSKLEAKQAKRIMPSGAVVSLPLEDVQKGDLLQVNEGDAIPTDGIIKEGEGTVDESMLTGESEPIFKSAGDKIVGASILRSGTIKMTVTATGNDTVLQKMIELVKTAQQDKPDIQKLADRISAIFVPVVLGIALLTFLVGHFAFGVSFQNALMNSIAVLVISCPCAMGLATPTAVMVGVGRMAKDGILVKGGQTLETFASVKNFVFDKTGTLTTGDFNVETITYYEDDQAHIRSLIRTLEQHSSHPIAQSLVKALSQESSNHVPHFSQIEERKGLGVFAQDEQGNQYAIGSQKIAEQLGRANGHAVYLTKNDRLLASIDIQDTLKTDAATTVDYLKKEGKTPIILSGDKQAKTAATAKAIGIEQFYAEQLPEEKLALIERLSNETPTAMIGDGINDAPALARATIGVSLSDASKVAIQSAQIVLLNGKLSHLNRAVAISKHTLLTIKQNLFWAFAYNIVAIPIAALGFLNPMLGALFMAFSDVVVIGNSIRLNHKKII